MSSTSVPGGRSATTRTGQKRVSGDVHTRRWFVMARRTGSADQPERELPMTDRATVVTPSLLFGILILALTVTHGWADHLLVALALGLLIGSYWLRGRTRAGLAGASPAPSQSRPAPVRDCSGAAVVRRDRGQPGELRRSCLAFRRPAAGGRSSPDSGIALGRSVPGCSAGNPRRRETPRRFPVRRPAGRLCGFPCGLCAGRHQWTDGRTG